jgi:transcriptional regulator with XRE-family HTH domain
VSLDNLSPEQRAVYNIIAKYGPIGGKEITERLFPGVEITKESKEWAGVRKKTARLEKLGLIAKGVGGYTCVQGVQGTPGTLAKVKAKPEPQVQAEPENELEGEPDLPDGDRAIKKIIGPGRPTLYLDEYCDLARRLGLVGLTDEEIATVLNVSVRTLYRWKNDHPEFCQALLNGKLMADAEVAQGLFDRARGFSVKAEKVFNNQGEIVRAEYDEYYPPDVGAAKLWLCNRQPDKWRDKVEYEPPEDLKAIPFDELEKINQKAHEEAERKHREIVEGRAERLGIKLDYTSEDESD